MILHVNTILLSMSRNSMRSNLKSLATIANLRPAFIPMALNNTTFICRYTFELKGVSTGANHMRIFLSLRGKSENSGAAMGRSITGQTEEMGLHNVRLNKSMAVNGFV